LGTEREVAPVLTVDRPLVIFDLETTGLDPTEDRIVEVSILRILPGWLEQPVQTRVINPGCPIPAAVTRLHGIGDKDVAGQPRFADIASDLFGCMSDYDLCGYNMIEFDFPFLFCELKRAGLCLSASGRRLIDPMRIWNAREGRPPKGFRGQRTLAAAMKEFGCEWTGPAHTAGADVIACRDVLVAQVERYGRGLVFGAEPYPAIIGASS